MRSYQTLSPATGQLLHSFPEITTHEAQSALSTAHTRYTTEWSARIMRLQSYQLATLITLEMGKLISEAYSEVELSASILEYYATHAEHFLKDADNFPYYQLARVAGPQLVARNALIVKHARNVPQCAMAFAQVLAEAGAPEGVYTNLFCSFDQIDMFMDDFRVVLELGGSDPFIVLEDADLKAAVKEGAKGQLLVMGQVCVSAKRFIVVGRERGNLFLEGLAKMFESLKVGIPEDKETTLGPLSSEQGTNDLLEQIEVAKRYGARVVMGGQRINRPGFYVQPAIITDVSSDNPLFQQETFGPVASFYVVDTEMQAIELANATKFGLGASVFGTDLSGMVFINSAAYFAPELPFGGVKNSEFGRGLGKMGIGEFVNRKLVRTA
ncbi:ALDH-like protein [Acephala macrosclerotiorum]|nr:ALDH-like protein [Acephala macrosclerotiorum]